MGESTSIGWCDATFNPWWGCERVSPACAHCYADDQAKRYGHRVWGPGHAFRFLSDGNWMKPLRWAELARAGLLPNGDENPDGHRPRVFCASMADVFEERPELRDPRMRLFQVIRATPELDWLVLTKRPEYARDWMRGYLRDDAPLVVPYGRTTEARGELEPMPTQMTRERFALVVPPSTNGAARDAHTQPSFVQVTETRPMLVKLPE